MDCLHTLREAQMYYTTKQLENLVILAVEFSHHWVRHTANALGIELALAGKILPHLQVLNACGRLQDFIENAIQVYGPNDGIQIGRAHV